MIFDFSFLCDLQSKTCKLTLHLPVTNFCVSGTSVLLKSPVILIITLSKNCYLLIHSYLPSGFIDIL